MTWLIASKVTRQFSLSIFQTTRWNAPRAVPHPVGEHASKSVGRTASRKRHYDSDRPRRQRLCPRQTPGEQRRVVTASQWRSVRRRKFITSATSYLGNYTRVSAAGPAVLYSV